MLAFSRARQQKRGDIRTSDQQEERDRTKENPQRTARAIDCAVFEWQKLDCQVSICFGKLPPKLGLHFGDIRSPLGDIHTGFEAADYGEPRVLPALGIWCIYRHRRPQIDT